MGHPTAMARGRDGEVAKFGGWNQGALAGTLQSSHPTRTNNPTLAQKHAGYPIVTDAHHPRIRPLTADDIDTILAVQRRCYADGFLESAEAFRSKLAATAQTCWLVSQADTAIGYLIALPVRYDTFPRLNAPTFVASPTPELLYIHDLAITPAGRALGLGGQLLEHALQAAAAQRIRRAGLIAVQDSVDYWTRRGFRLIDPVPPVLSEKLASFGEDARYMEKVLS